MESEDIHYLHSLITVGKLYKNNLYENYSMSIAKGKGPPGHDRDEAKSMVGRNGVSL